VDKDKAENELVVNIKKATSPEETAPKQKHVRSTLRNYVSGLNTDLYLECIVFTWDYHSSISFWSGLRVQPILADEVQTFKALITVHKVLQEGHPIVSFAAQQDIFLLLTVNLRPSRKLMAKQHGWKPVQGQ
jgi:huntingtin-interacting protein 1-related protein